MNNDELYQQIKGWFILTIFVNLFIVVFFTALFSQFKG